jgi:hypothetical protein
MEILATFKAELLLQERLIWPCTGAETEKPVGTVLGLQVVPFKVEPVGQEYATDALIVLAGVVTVDPGTLHELPERVPEVHLAEAG